MDRAGAETVDRKIDADAGINPNAASYYPHPSPLDRGKTGDYPPIPVILRAAKEVVGGDLP